MSQGTRSRLVILCPTATARCGTDFVSGPQTCVGVVACSERTEPSWRLLDAQQREALGEFVNVVVWGAAAGTREQQ